MSRAHPLFCTLTRALLCNQTTQRSKGQSWEAGILGWRGLTVCWSLISFMAFFPALLGAAQEAYHMRGNLWSYVLRVAGSKQAIIPTLLLVGIMAYCRNLQKWALSDVFSTCSFGTGWKCILKCCSSAPAFYALLLYYVRWRALFGCYTYSAWFGLIWFCLLI